MRSRNDPPNIWWLRLTARTNDSKADRLRLKSNTADEASGPPEDRLLTIPWQKPPTKRRRQILLPNNKSSSEVRPQHFERRAQLVSAIAKGRQWLDDVVSGRTITVAELRARENCSVRQINMTLSLAFLAPNLVKAIIEGRLPRGIGIERLRDLPSEWNLAASSKSSGLQSGIGQPSESANSSVVAFVLAV